MEGKGHKMEYYYSQHVSKTPVKISGVGSTASTESHTQPLTAANARYLRTRCKEDFWTKVQDGILPTLNRQMVNPVTEVLLPLPKASFV